MAQGQRFDQLCRSLGLAPCDVAQLLHVSLRTVHNWRAGVHPVPYTAFKLVRVLCYYELPFPGWKGWRFVGGKLVSPEGHTFVGTDSSWWSHLVRKAELFTQLYQECWSLRKQLEEVAGRPVGALARAPVDQAVSMRQDTHALVSSTLRSAPSSPLLKLNLSTTGQGWSLPQAGVVAPPESLTGETSAASRGPLSTASTAARGAL